MHSTQKYIYLRESVTYKFCLKAISATLRRPSLISMAGRSELNLGKQQPQEYDLCLMVNLFLGAQFHFISIENPDSRAARRVARSHAVARGLENKRKLQQRSGHNFHVVPFTDDPDLPARKRKRGQPLVATPCSLSPDMPDPFQMLAAESPRLRTLLSCREIFTSVQNYRRRLT